MKSSISLQKRLRLSIMICLFICVCLTLLFYYILELISPHENLTKSILYIAIALVISSGAGSIVTYFLMRSTSNFYMKLIRSINQVSLGNFNVRIEKTNIDYFDRPINDFNKMVEDLSYINTIQRDFISDFSHEIKTPIVSINGFADILLKDNNLDEKTKKEYLQIIYDETNRLSSLSSNILMILKLETQKEVFEKNQFIIDEQIRQVILLLYNDWNTKNITFNLNLERVIYFGSENLLKQVWINLISNAIKYSYNNSQIDISLTKNNNFVTFEIKDYGHGMNAETKDHMFDKFYQGDKSHSSSGNGLGLSIVKKIVLLSNGDINVQSELNKGTTFQIILPNEK